MSCCVEVQAVQDNEESAFSTIGSLVLGTPSPFPLQPYNVKSGIDSFYSTHSHDSTWVNYRRFGLWGKLSHSLMDSSSGLSGPPGSAVAKSLQRPFLWKLQSQIAQSSSVMCKNLSCEPWEHPNLNRFSMWRQNARGQLWRSQCTFFNARSVKNHQFCQCVVLPGKDAMNPPAPHCWFSHPFMVTATADQHTLTLLSSSYRPGFLGLE